MQSKIVNDIASRKINVTEDLLIERLIDRYRWPKFYPTGAPTLERIEHSGEKVQDFFANDGYVDTHEILKFYNDGYTLIISGVQHLFKDIHNITADLYDELGYIVNSNIYFSKGQKKVSFDSHSHEYDVIVKNIAGKSKWIINNQEAYLQDQDVFYITKNIDHCVTEITSTKISITFNLLRP